MQSRAREKSAYQSWSSISSKASTLKESTNTTKKNEDNVGWSGLHCQFTQVPDMRDLILLYSDSTDTVLYNQNYGKEIKASEKPLTLGTNGEPMVTKQRYEVTELCEH